MNPYDLEAVGKMLSKQEANEYYKDEAERYRAMADDVQHQIYQQQIRAQSTPPPQPTFWNAERASLAQDGIVIEAGNGMERVVVRGEMLKTLAVLVTMAQMAGLLAKDDEPQTLG